MAEARREAPEPVGLFDPSVVVDHLFDGVYAVDTNRRILFWNKGAERITGYAAHEIVGRACYDNILDHVDLQGHRLCFEENACPLVESIRTNSEQSRVAFLRRKDGTRAQVLIRVLPVERDGRVIGAVEVFTDNTETIRLQQENERLRREAMLDPLLFIGNRRFLEIALTKQLAVFERYRYAFGVLFLDLDDFKDVNDTFGHDAGDHVLKVFAATVLNSIRAGDTLGRWGGEEFLVVSSLSSSTQLTMYAERLRALVAAMEPSWEGQRIPVTVSIGATLARPGDTVETIVARADDLMYASKRGGKNRVTVG